MPQLLKGIGLGFALLGVLLIGKPESRYRWSATAKLRNVLHAVSRFKKVGSPPSLRALLYHSDASPTSGVGNVLVRVNQRAVVPADVPADVPEL